MAVAEQPQLLLEGYTAHSPAVDQQVLPLNDCCIIRKEADAQTNLICMSRRPAAALGHGIPWNLSAIEVRWVQREVHLVEH